MHTVAFCEIDPYCRAVIAKHWPGVPIFGDICALSAEKLADPNGSGFKRWTGDKPAQVSQTGNQSCDKSSAESPAIDLICGGFPCQDISVAGKGAGLAGARSGLWREYLRLIGELRPRYVIVENVAALLGRGLGTVLGDLASIGYDAEWHCVPASYVGAPHRRDRVWIIAHPNSQGSQGRGGTALSGRDTSAGHTGASDWWGVEPDVGRVAHGIPNRVDRLKGLGNAIVPQIAEMIGSAIMRFESQWN